MEEERRLCYVGMTRAMEQLVLSCARARKLYQKPAPKLPSRFLAEIPAEVIEITGGDRESLARPGAGAALPLAPGKTAERDADTARKTGKRLKSTPRNTTGVGKAPSAARKGGRQQQSKDQESRRRSRKRA